MGATEQHSSSSAPSQHSNGIVVTPLPHDDEQLPPSVPSGYPQDDMHTSQARSSQLESQEEPKKYFNEVSYEGMQHGQPAPVVQGMQAGPVSTGQTMFFPASQEGPIFLGATIGHHPIPIQCGACGYQGLSHVAQTRGFAHGMWGVMTLGLGLLCKVGMDTHHWCPQCKRHLADAKLM